MYEYSVEAIANNDGEKIISEWIHNQDGVAIDQRRHESNEEKIEGVTVIHRCTIPQTIGSLGLVNLSHVGIEANGESYDLECVIV